MEELRQKLIKELEENRYVFCNFETGEIIASHHNIQRNIQQDCYLGFERVKKSTLNELLDCYTKENRLLTECK